MGISARPPYKNISKTAPGATESVDWEYRPDIIPVISEIKSKGYKIFAVEQADESIDLGHFQPETGCKLALVFGHEVFGVKDEIVKLADGCIEIPQFGTKHSFNVAISAVIVLWYIVNKIKGCP